MSTTVTIRARLQEKVTDEGTGYPDAVHITGAQFLNRSAVQDIAQETVNSYYGSNDHDYVAVVNYDRYIEYHNAGTDTGLTVPVVAV